MGVDCNVWLPPGTRIRDVATVINICAGHPAVRKEFERNDGWYAESEVDGFKFHDHSPHYVDILYHHPDGEKRFAMYFFECSEKPGYVNLYIRSTAWCIALAKKLVDFFGGIADYNDCDAVDVNYQKEPNPLRLATNAEEWEALQQAFMDVQPITAGDLLEAQPYAGYQEHIQPYLKAAVDALIEEEKVLSGASNRTYLDEEPKSSKTDASGTGRMYL